MIKHIVMIRLEISSPSEKEAALNKLKNLLDELADKIEIIKSLETGINFNTRPTAFDLALIVTLNTKEDIEIYRSHPEHIKVLNFMRTLELSTAVVDYEEEYSKR